MKLFRYMLPTVMAAVAFSASAFASCDCNFSEVRDELDERDFDAVIEFINSKRTIELQEKASNLAISGDVRAEWAHYHEKVNGENRRGNGAHDLSGTNGAANPNGPIIGSNDYDVELNLHFDYKCDRTWGVAHLEFDNPMGVKESKKRCSSQTGTSGGDTAAQNFDDHTCHGSGRCDSICLRKAYMGYNVCADGCSRFDIEVGRRRLYDAFDSRVQFNSIFDGVLLRYATQLDCCSDAYVNFGALVVDSRARHYAWVLEAGLLNVCDTGFDVKYSYIDWLKHGRNRCDQTKPIGFRHQIHQFAANYHFCPEVLCMPAKAYAAILWNDAARSSDLTNRKREDLAWYIGAVIGEVAGEGDWALDINYQYVEAQAVPDCDVAGIGRGNVYNETFTQQLSTATAVAAANARGNANYKGFKISGLYAVTDNLNLDASFSYSNAADKGIGGTLNFSKFKLAAIYAF